MSPKHTVFLSSVSLAIGILFFCLYNNWVIVTLSAPGFIKRQPIAIPNTPKRIFSLWYWHNHQLKQEKKEILWSDNVLANCSRIMKAWLSILDEEEVTSKPCSCNAVAFSPYQQELLVSLDQGLFSLESSTYDKLMLIESLLKTLRAAHISSGSVRFLVHHEPLDDPHLDFSFSWPLDGFVEQAQKYAPDANQTPINRKKTQGPFTLMLDPAGDARSTGRIINDSFERSITLQCAEAIKEHLQELLPTVRVILTRLPGETIEHLQNAAFANRLNVDLYVSVHCYPEKEDTPFLSIYYYSRELFNKLWPKPEACSSFLAYHQAYRPMVAASYLLAHELKSSLERYLKSAPGCPSLVRGPLGIPFKPLVGVQAPAVACEIAFSGANSGSVFARACAEALRDLILSHYAPDSSPSHSAQ
jgi:N-acetylmuramoyl-L-alanine amidase